MAWRSGSISMALDWESASSSCNGSREKAEPSSR